MEKELSIPTVIELDVERLSNIPEKVQQYLCLLACGFSPASVARLAGVTDSSVHQAVKRYDPNREFTLTAREKRRFLEALWEARAGEALLHITPDKLADSTAIQLAKIAQVAGNEANRLHSDDDEPTKDPYSLIDELGA